MPCPLLPRTRSALACAFLVLAATGRAQPVYHIEPIGIPDYSQAHAISNRGDIVGYAFAPYERAVLLPADGGKARLLTKKAGLTFGEAVNGLDMVAYTLVDAEVLRCGFWDPRAGRHRLLGTLGGDACTASGIDGRGRIVGSSTLADGRSRAFLDDGLHMRDLGTLGGDNSGAAGINARGQVAGTAQRADGQSHAFIYGHGRMTDLGDLGSGHSGAAGISSNGHVAGTSSLPNARKGHDHAFLWDGQSMRDLGTLGGKFSYASSVNAADEVVGISRLEGEGDPAQHGFLYSGGTMYNLIDLLDESRQGWDVLITAEGINDRGDIVGLGFYEGHQHAYVARRVSR